MDIGQIFKRLGGAALKSIPPLGVATEILSFVNDVLPKNKQLSESSTGDQAMTAIAELPKGKQTEVLLKQFDVELAEISAHVDIVKCLADVDKTGHSTRPEIARAQSHLIGFGVVTTIGSICYAIVAGDEKLVESISSIWPLISAVLGIPASIVLRYFGARMKEKQQKYEAVSNTSPAVGLVSQIVGKLIKG